MITKIEFQMMLQTMLQTMLIGVAILICEEIHEFHLSVLSKDQAINSHAIYLFSLLNKLNFWYHLQIENEDRNPKPVTVA